MLGLPPGTPCERPSGKRKAALRQPSRKTLNFFDKSGAGEGIRTLDPNLGKVVLYP